MRILALVPEDSLSVLSGALAREHALGWVHDAGSLAQLANAPDVDAVVVDPASVPDDDWGRLRALLATPRVPLLLYGRLTPASARRIVAAAAVVPHEIILRGMDDDPATIRASVQRLRTPAPPARVLARLAARVASMPPVLQQVTVPVFCSGVVPRWADDVARAAGLARRTVDRWIKRAGFTGTAALLDIARLSRVWVPIVDDGADPALVATHNGYIRPRMLVMHAQRILGVTPATFGKRLDADEFVDRLSRHVLRPQVQVVSGTRAPS